MAVDNELIKFVTTLVVDEIGKLGHKMALSSPRYVNVGISARHVHLQRDHVEALFGKDYRLTHFKDLSQPGQFAANEAVTIIGPRGKIEKVRILGPERPHTQVEVAASDARILGINTEVRNSGDVKGTPGLTIIGPQGSIEIKEGVILADRHIHMSPQEADLYGVKNGQKVSVVVPGNRGGIINNVTVRVSENYRLDMHIDTDEANAFLVKQGDKLEIVSQIGR